MYIARSQTPLETLPTTANPLTLKYPLTSAPSGNNLSTTSGRGGVAANILMCFHCNNDFIHNTFRM